MNKSLMRIGEPAQFALWVQRMRRVVRGTGRVVAEYPQTLEVDVMDSRGHVWRTDYLKAFSRHGI